MKFRATLTAGALALSSTAAQAVLSAQIEFDFNPRDSGDQLGGVGAVGGLDITGTEVSAPIFNLGASASPQNDRIELLSAGASLAIPDAPWVNSLTMTPTIGAMNASWAFPSVGDSAVIAPATAPTNPAPGFGAGGQVGTSAGGTNLRTVNFSFDQPVLLTEVNGNWWDTTFDGSPTDDSMQLNFNGQSWNFANGFSPGQANNWTTAVSSGLTTSTVGGVTGFLISPGSPIELTVWDADGDGILENNGLIEGFRLHVVPEPSRALLLFVGLSLALLGRRRR